MPGRLTLGIDLGTSSCKVTALRIDGALLGTARAEYPTHTPEDGWAEQDPDDWLPAVAEATRNVMAAASLDPGGVAGIGLTGAAHVTVLLDAAGRPVRRAILWSDTRSTAEAREIDERIGPIVARQTLNAASPTWSLPHLAWVKRHEADLWRRMAQVCLSKDYLARALTGAWVTDPGTATSSLLFDAIGGGWSSDICTWLGLSADRLPAVAPAREIVGGLSGPAASALGLARGTPVVNGALDSATETYAAGARRPGATVIRLGTAGGIHVVSDRPFGDRRLIAYPYPDEPFWYSQAGTSAAGASIAWARTALGGGRVLSYRDLDALAAACGPGADGVLFHPYLSGERCPYWDGSLRGSFSGLSTRHGASHLARAVVEGVALSLYDAYSVFRACGVAPGPTSVVGGGCRNRLLLRVLSTLFERPLAVRAQADSSFGAALLAVEAHTGRRQPAPAAQGATVEPMRDLGELYGQLAAEYATWAPRLRRR